MNKFRRLAGFAAMAVLLGLLPTAKVLADAEMIRQAERDGYVTPLSELIDSIEGTFPGRILKVDLAPEQEESERPSSWIYELKVLQSDGQVLVILFDAKTLEPLEVNGQSYGAKDLEENR